LPYGKRSGFSVHLITSLKNFLPEPELSKFIPWLNQNKEWLLEEYRKDGGVLAENWINTHQDLIENNEWEPLFIPRCFFGKYLKEKVENSIKECVAEGKIEVNYCIGEAVDIEKLDDGYKLYLNNKKVLSSTKVILSVGSLPVRNLWKKEALVQEDNLLFINNPYTPELNNVLGVINDFVKRQLTKINVLIVGANASGLEMLYKLNDLEEVSSKINKFTVLSTQGVLPDSIVDEEKLKGYEPIHLNKLDVESNITAKQIAEAAYKDLDEAEKIELGAASTVFVISKAFGALLNKLDEKELKDFACNYGNEIGRRQRCAGYHYSKRVDELKEQNRFEHVAGRFVNVHGNGSEAYKVEYLDTQSKTNMYLDDPNHIVINCVGSTNFGNEEVPQLLEKMVSKSLCEPNCSKVGVDVNELLETAENLHIVGPLLAGNVIEEKAVWHVEHCGRIIWISKLMSEILTKHFFKN